MQTLKKTFLACLFVCFVIGILKGQFSLTYVGWFAKQSGSLYKSGSWVDHTVKTKGSDWKQMWHFKSFHCKKQKRDKDGAGAWLKDTAYFHRHTSALTKRKLVAAPHSKYMEKIIFLYVHKKKHWFRSWLLWDTINTQTWNSGWNLMTTSFKPVGIVW